MKNFPRAAPFLVTVAVVALSVSACAQTRDKGWRSEGAPSAAPVGAAPAPAAAEPTPSGAPPASSDPANPRNYLTFTVKVTGMTCPFSCVRDVREQLSAVPGVLHVEIDWDASKAVVDVQPGTDPATLVQGLKAPYAGRLL